MDRRLGPFIAAVLYFAIHASCHIRVWGQKGLNEAQRSGRPLVIVFWHGRHFLFITFFKDSGIEVMVSPSRDGQRIAALLKYSGFRVLHGSSHKSPVRALAQAVRHVQAGQDLAVTVDGPRGPIYQVKPGAAYAALKGEALIIPFTFSARPALRLRSWDRFMIPLPGSRVGVVIGEPIDPREKTSVETLCHEIERVLTRTTRLADAWVDRKERQHCRNGDI